MIARAERITRPVPLILLIPTVPYFRGALAGLFEGGFGGRQAAFVAAGAVFEIAVNVVFGFCEADLLDEGGLILEVLQFHVEHLVHLCDDLALRCEFANQFGALHLHHVEGSLDGAVVADVGGIDVPTLIYCGVEDDFRLCPFTGLEL